MKLLALLMTVMVCCCGLGSGHGRVMMLRASHYLNASNTSITVTLDSSAFGKLDFSVPGYGKFSNVTTVQVPPGLSCFTFTLYIRADAGSTNVTDNFTLDKIANQTEYTMVVYGDSVAHSSVWINQSSTNNAPPTLGIDQARIVVYNLMPVPLNCFELSANCYTCIPTPVGVVYPGGVANITVATRFSMTHYFNFSNGTLYYNLSRMYTEHSITTLTITRNSKNIIPVTSEPGDNAYLPILYAAIVIIGLFVIVYILGVTYQWLDKRGMLHWRSVDRAFDKDMGNPNKAYAVNSTEKSPLLDHDVGDKEKAAVKEGGGAGRSAGEAKKKKERLRSLDTFRGLSLVVMIFVNYGGGGYWFFSHSAWNGVTVADLVFPWFVWIMGVSVVFSFRGRRSDSYISRLYQVVRRSIILMGLGLFLNNGVNLTHWRIPGVLQRFAISYFIVAITELLTFPIYNRWKTVWRYEYVVRDITANFIQLIIMVLLEVVWLAITFGLLVPDCPRGYLGPGGLADYNRYPNCTGGAAGYIDKVFFSIDHIYQHPTSKALYQSCAYDPEGLLGSINSIVICFLGVQAGRIITYHSVHWHRLLRFIIWGVVLCGIAVALCGASKNNGVIPLNKNLWSLSFILLMAGTGFLLLAALYFIIDVLRVWRGAPFIYPGMNSIMVYVGSELLEDHFPFSWDGKNNSHLELLSSNLVGVSMWLIIAYYWYWIGFFVKI